MQGMAPNNHGFSYQKLIMYLANDLGLNKCPHHRLAQTAWHPRSQQKPRISHSTITAWGCFSKNGYPQLSFYSNHFLSTEPTVTLGLPILRNTRWQGSHQHSTIAFAIDFVGPRGPPELLQAKASHKIWWFKIDGGWYGWYSHWLIYWLIYSLVYLLIYWLIYWLIFCNIQNWLISRSLDNWLMVSSTIINGCKELCQHEAVLLPNGESTVLWELTHL